MNGGYAKLQANLGVSLQQSGVGELLSGWFVNAFVQENLK